MTASQKFLSARGPKAFFGKSKSWHPPLGQGRPELLAMQDDDLAPATGVIVAIGITLLGCCFAIALGLAL